MCVEKRRTARTKSQTFLSKRNHKLIPAMVGMRLNKTSQPSSSAVIPIKTHKQQYTVLPELQGKFAYVATNISRQALRCTNLHYVAMSSILFVPFYFDF